MASIPLEPTLEYEKPLHEKALILAGVFIPLVATLYGMVQLWQRYFDALDLALLVTFYVLTGFGVTIGFHRLLTHRSFETNPVLKAIFIILGCMALQGNPISWASTHIEHHAKADKEGDPHSPLEGLWHAHMGWAFNYHPQLDKYGTWLVKDRLIVFIDRFWIVWFALGLVIPFAIGGWTGLLWGGLVRIFLMQHSTGSVNSICHTFGARPYATPDVSRNNWWVGIIALGEGWHNNHHAFPRSAFHGLKWWQFDFSAYLIRAMEAVGLVWDVQRISADQQRRRAGVPAE